MSLYNRDAVQTFRRSGARVTFDEKNHLELGEKTLVIIKQIGRDPLLREKRSFMVIVDGEIHGTIADSGTESVHVQVATPSAVARVRTRQSADGRADFKITVNPDQSSTIAVFHGVAEVTGEGETIRIDANHSTTVNPGERPMSPERLPDPPVLASPSDSSLFYYRDLPPKVQFEWEVSADAVQYRFVLARDPRFKDILYEGKLPHPRFSHGNLKKGDYYWRVSTIKRKAEGNLSPTRRFRVIQDREAPNLRVVFPPEIMNRNDYLLTGEAEPGAQVYIGGRPVPTDKTGQFEYRLQLEHGINVIVVEAVDRVGNITYRSQLVNGIF